MTRPTLLTLLSGFAAAPLPHAVGQWVVINLHPAGATESSAEAIEGAQQGGYAVINGVRHACLWNGTAASWVDLHPAGATGSMIRDVHAGQQVGYTGIPENSHAALWSGTAASWVDLTPAGSPYSEAYGIHAGQQVGFAVVGGAHRASLWSGTAASWVDLHPVGAIESGAEAVFAGQQAGAAQFAGGGGACRWSGSAASYVNLSSAGGGGGVFDMDDGQIVGFGYGRRATLYSAGSWINLHPTTPAESYASGVYAGTQVGQVYFSAGPSNLRFHAGLWTGTAASWEDLHLVLPGEWGHTDAKSVWSDATTLYIVGEGENFITGRKEALLWMRPIPPPAGCYPNCDASTAAPILNIADFSCFLNRFFASETYANCDASTIAPVLNVADFTCFLNAFAAGCT